MRPPKHAILTLLFASGAIGGAATAVKQAHADVIPTFTINIYQSGSNVEIDGSGTIDLSGLTWAYFAQNANWNLITPSLGIILNLNGLINYYSGVSTWSPFGTFESVASTYSGDSFGIQGYQNGYITVPANYISGFPLSFTQTYDSQTLTSMGLLLGNYTYTWGSGANLDALQILVGTAPTLPTAPSPPADVPEPTSITVIATGFVGLGLAHRRRALRKVN